METLDGEKPRDFLVVFIDVLEQYPVAPDAEPAVDAARPDRSLLRVQLLQGLLDALQAVLRHLRHGTAEVEHSTPADWSRVAHLKSQHHRGPGKEATCLVREHPHGVSLVFSTDLPSRNFIDNKIGAESRSPHVSARKSCHPR